MQKKRNSNIKETDLSNLKEGDQSGENSSLKSFEEMLNRLEDISTQLDSDTIGLDRAIELYEEGTKLSAICFKMLNEAQLKVSILKKNDENITAEENGLDIE